MRVYNLTTTALLLLLSALTTRAYDGFAEDFAKYRSKLKSKGGVFNTVVREEWEKLKASIGCNTADIISPLTELQVKDWRNTATTEEQLHALVEAFGKRYFEFVEKAAAQVPGAAAKFGPNDCCMVKSKSSIATKFARLIAYGQTVPASTIFDMLRSTIVVKDIPTLRSVLNTLLQRAKVNGYEIHIQNRYLWDGFCAGYVGHHVLVLLKHGGQSIISEIQVHFEAIQDGSQECPNEFAHKTYEKLRVLEDQTKAEDLITEQELAFAFGMSRVPAYHSSSNSRLQTCPLPIKSDYSLREGKIYQSKGLLQLSRFDEHTGTWVKVEDTQVIEEILKEGILLTVKDAEAFLKSVKSKPLFSSFLE